MPLLENYFRILGRNFSLELFRRTKYARLGNFDKSLNFYDWLPAQVYNQFDTVLKFFISQKYIYLGLIIFYFRMKQKKRDKEAEKLGRIEAKLEPTNSPWKNSTPSCLNVTFLPNCLFSYFLQMSSYQFRTKNIIDSFIRKNHQFFTHFIIFGKS